MLMLVPSERDDVLPQMLLLHVILMLLAAAAAADELAVEAVWAVSVVTVRALPGTLTPALALPEEVLMKSKLLLPAEDAPLMPRKGDSGTSSSS